MTRTLIAFDWAAKKILRSKANFGVLEGFLSELLREDIKIQDILESESNQEDEKGKHNRVDLLVKNSKGELIIIEVQFEHQMDYLHRILYGTSKVITEYLKRGDKYLSVKKVISINIVYFDIGQGSDYVYKGTTKFVGIHNHEVLQLTEDRKIKFNKKVVSDIFPEYYLLKVNNFDDVAKDPLDQWVYLFKNSAVKDSFKAKGIKEAKRVLDLAKLSDEERREYYRYEESLHDKASYFDSTFDEGERKGEIKGEKKGIKKGLKEGMKKGIEKGKKGAALEIARSMLQDGLPTETVAKCSGLSVDEINNLGV